jgi:hypothetical protein
MSITGYSERGFNDNNRGVSAGFRWSRQSMSWSRAAFPSRRSSVRKSWFLPNPADAGVVAIGDVCGGAQNSSGFARIGAIYMQATPALLTLGALARAMQLVDAGIGLFQRDLRKNAGPLVLAVLQSSWFICFTYPCGLRHKPSANKGTYRLAPETGSVQFHLNFLRRSRLQMRLNSIAQTANCGLQATNVLGM